MMTGQILVQPITVPFLFRKVDSVPIPISDSNSWNSIRIETSNSDSDLSSDVQFPILTSDTDVHLIIGYRL